MKKRSPKSPIPARESKRTTSPSMEQYIETIAHLLTKDKVCSISDIANEAQVSRPAASRAVRDLAGKKLVEHRAYGYVDLTPQGQSLADRLTARHEALFHFLHGILQFDEDHADEEACRLEHQLDDEIVGRMAMLADLIEKDVDLNAKWQRLMKRRRPVA